MTGKQNGFASQKLRRTKRVYFFASIRRQHILSSLMPLVYLDYDLWTNIEKDRLGVKW